MVASPLPIGGGRSCHNRIRRLSRPTMMKPNHPPGPPMTLGIFTSAVSAAAVQYDYPRVETGGGGGAIIYFTPIEKMLTLALESPV